MIPIQSALFSTLGSYAGLSALVGARIYPDLAPQQVARPFVVWSEISTVPTANVKDGTSETGSLINYRIQITSWATNQTLVREVDAQVRLAMQGASAFKSMLVDGRAHDYEEDTKLFAFSSDFSVWLKT